MKTTLFIIALLFVSLGVGAFLAFPKHKSTVVREGAYVIDMPYDKVKKILICGNSLPRILAYQTGELITRKTNSVTLSSNKLLPISDWRADMKGEFTARFKTYDGPVVLSFNQEAFAGKSSLYSRVSLARPDCRIKEIEITTSMCVLDNDRTEVKTMVVLIYERHIPFWYKDFMNAKVAEAGDNMIIRGQDAMLKLMDKYKDKKFIIPLGRGNV